MQILVEDLDLAGALDVAGGDLCRAADVEAQNHVFLCSGGDDDVLDVQDHVGDVFADTSDGVELVQCVIEANGRDGRAGDARQQGTAQRVADGVAEAGLERADRKPLTDCVVLAECFDGGALNNEHVGRLDPFGVPNYLE